MNQRWSLIALLVGAMLALAACGASAPTAEPTASEAATSEATATSAATAPTEPTATAAEQAASPPTDGGAAAQITAALVVGVKGDPFYVTMERGARAKAEELGVELIVDGPAQFNPVQQTPIVDALIARGIDVLIIAATDKQAMIEPLRRAHDAGIPVISVDTFIGDGDYANGPVTFPLSYIGSDNVEGGRIACESLIEAMGGAGSIYIQNVKPGISTTDQREQGCKEAIEATGGAVTLVATDYNDDSAAKAAEQTTGLLQRTPDLGGIFGTNLFSAEGAAQAVKNAGLQGTVKIANFDAPEQAIKDLRENVVDLVIAQQPAEMGNTAIEYAVAAVNGDTSSIQKRVPTGYVVIDRDNVDTPEAQAAVYTGE
jgi:ribose transport system substrate-binding protein